MFKKILSLGLLLSTLLYTKASEAVKPQVYDEIDLANFIDDELASTDEGMIENYALDEAKNEYYFTNWIKVIYIPLGTYNIKDDIMINLEKYNENKDNIVYHFAFRNQRVIARLKFINIKRLKFCSYQKIWTDSFPMRDILKVKNIIMDKN